MQVPPGPFSFSGLSLLGGRTDLEVTVIESDGTPAFLRGTCVIVCRNHACPTGLFVFARTRPVTFLPPNRGVVTGAGSWVLGQQATGTIGLMGAAPYQALGLGLDARPWQNTTISVRNAFSNAT